MRDITDKTSRTSSSQGDTQVQTLPAGFRGVKQAGCTLLAVSSFPTALSERGKSAVPNSRIAVQAEPHVNPFAINELPRKHPPIFPIGNACIASTSLASSLWARFRGPARRDSFDLQSPGDSSVSTNSTHSRRFAPIPALLLASCSPGFFTHALRRLRRTANRTPTSPSVARPVSGPCPPTKELTSTPNPSPPALPKMCRWPLPPGRPRRPPVPP